MAYLRAASESVLAIAIRSRVNIVLHVLKSYCRQSSFGSHAVPPLGVFWDETKAQPMVLTGSQLFPLKPACTITEGSRRALA